MLPNYIEEAVGKLIALLANREYAMVEHLTGSKGLSAQEIEKSILEYGRTLIAPQASAYGRLIDAVRITGAIPERWSVVVPLWTREEGRSDLSLDVTVEEADNELGFRVEVNAIHVR